MNPDTFVCLLMTQKKPYNLHIDIEHIIGLTHTHSQHARVREAHKIGQKKQ